MRLEITIFLISFPPCLFIDWGFFMFYQQEFAVSSYLLFLVGDTPVFIHMILFLSMFYPHGV